MGPDVGYTMIDNGVIRGLTKSLRGWFFCLAFVSIGLATNFRELAGYFKGGKPLILYTIEAAIGCGLPRIIVSSEDAEIGRIAEAAGAEFRVMVLAIVSNKNILGCDFDAPLPFKGFRGIRQHGGQHHLHL